MFAVTTLCRVSLAICPRFYHEAWWGSLMSSLVEKLLKLNFLFFTRIFWYTTQRHSITTCTDGTRTSSLPINMSRVHLFYKLLWFNKSTAITIKMGNSEHWYLGSAPFILIYWSQCLVINIITFSSVCQAFWSNNIFSRFWELLKYWNIQYSRLALIFHF